MRLNVIIALLGVASAIHLQAVPAAQKTGIKLSQAKTKAHSKSKDGDSEALEGTTQNEITGEDEKVERKHQDIENERDKSQPKDDEGAVDEEKQQEFDDKTKAAAAKKTAEAEADIEAAENAGEK